MNTISNFLALAVLALVGVGAFWLGSLQSGKLAHQHALALGNWSARLKFKGFVFSAAMPLLWIAFYWSFIIHVRLSLGRWPDFGESLPGALLTLHYHSAMFWMVAMVWSLCFAAVMAGVCLCYRNWRSHSCYCLSYAATVGLAFGVLYLVPGPFLNWLLD